MTARLGGVRRITAGCLAVLTLLTGLLTVLGVDSPLRLLVTVAFVLTAPGWALAAYLRTDQVSLLWAVGVSLGLSLTILVAQTMVGTGFWRPEPAMLLLAGLTLAALVHHMLRRSDPVEPGRRGAAGRERGAHR